MSRVYRDLQPLVAVRRVSTHLTPDYEKRRVSQLRKARAAFAQNLNHGDQREFVDPRPSALVERRDGRWSFHHVTAPAASAIPIYRVQK